MRHKAKKNGVDFTFSDADLVNMSNADKALFVFESATQVPEFVIDAMDKKYILADTSPSATLHIDNTTHSPAPKKVRKNKKNGIPDKK